MPEQRSPLKEFRHLEEKLKTVGLSPAEQARYRQLQEIVSPRAPAPRPGFDVNAAAEELKASLEPAGPRRSPRPSPEPFAPAELAAAPAEPAAPAPGSYDQAAWDAGAPLPPLDPAAAFDLNAPPFDADRAEGRGAASDAEAPAEYEPGQRSYDLGPSAFDAAGLPPPEAGPGSYDQAPWDAVAGGAPAEPALVEAGAAPQGEPTEAELIEVEPVEAEPIEIPAAGPGTPDPAGAQLDGAAFGEAEPEPVPEPGAWPGAEAQSSEWTETAPGETDQAPGGNALEAGAAGGPTSLRPEEDLAFVLPEEVQPGAPRGAEPPAASASEPFALDPAPASTEAGNAPLFAGIAVEELPSIDVDVEEVVEAPKGASPPPPAPAAASPPARAVAPPSAPPSGLGGPSPTFVAGEHRVVVHTLEGQVLRGTIADADLDAPSIPLVKAPGAGPESLPASKVKAIFFMLLPGGRPPPPVGRKVRVTFRDGRQVAGFSADYNPEAVGFFMVPAESRTNTGRIWVYREAVRQVSVT